MRTLMDVRTLQDRMTSGLRTVVLDVRWALGDPHGREHYLGEHIPGAVYVDLETQLAAPPSPGAGRHPLPDAASFEEAAREWGINNADTVVAYDDVGGLSAARVWWLLKDGGFDNVFLLDGGLRAWQDAGFETDRGEELPCLGSVTLVPGQMPVLEIEDVRGFTSYGLLLDARAPERYRGETEPVDPKAGHIPGAVNAPTVSNLDAAGRFLPPEQLAARFRELGVAPGRATGVYCGSGITAAHEVAALAHAGLQAALYPGSWSQWSQRSDLPVALGSQPGGTTVGTDPEPVTRPRSQLAG